MLGVHFLSFDRRIYLWNFNPFQHKEHHNHHEKFPLVKSITAYIPTEATILIFSPTDYSFASSTISYKGNHTMYFFMQLPSLSMFLKLVYIAVYINSPFLFYC